MARIIDAFTQFFDDNGDPLVDGYLRFTESGTNNTDKDTFADINEKIANENPLQLDGAGRCPNVFGTGSYSVKLYDSDMQQIQQFDPVSSDDRTEAFAVWSSPKIYDISDLVTGSDLKYYRSLSNNNQNNNPVTTTGSWAEVNFNPEVYHNGQVMSYGGTPDAITLTSQNTAATTELVIGYYLFTATSTNTGACTANIDGLGAVACKTSTGDITPSGYIKTDRPTHGYYNGVDLILSYPMPDEQAFGTDQSWVDVAGSRSAGVTYTNTTKKPRVARVRVVSGAINEVSILSVDGIEVDVIQAYSGGVQLGLSAIIPSGSTYLLSLGGTTIIGQWKELG